MFPGDVDILWPKAASPEGRAELAWEVDVGFSHGFS